MVELSVKYEKTVKVDSDIKDCWKLLYDYERSVGHMNNIKTFKKLKKDHYYWETKPVGVGALSFKMNYETTFKTAKHKTIEWLPVKGAGNAEVHGSWEFTPLENGTKMKFFNAARFSLKIPSLLRGPAEKMSQKELEKTINDYINGIQNTLKKMSKESAKAPAKPKKAATKKTAAKPKAKTTTKKAAAKPKAKAAPKKTAAKPKAKPKAKAAAKKTTAKSKKK